MLSTKSGATLADAIKKAINDHQITTTEYDEIMQLAHQDRVVDNHEQALLRELNNLIADGVVKRVP